MRVLTRNFSKELFCGNRFLFQSLPCLLLPQCHKLVQRVEIFTRHHIQDLVKSPRVIRSFYDVSGNVSFVIIDCWKIIPLARQYSVLMQKLSIVTCFIRYERKGLPWISPSPMMLTLSRTGGETSAWPRRGTKKDCKKLLQINMCGIPWFLMFRLIWFLIINIVFAGSTGSTCSASMPNSEGMNLWSVVKRKIIYFSSFCSNRYEKET